jgi:1-acyl-sn-glycerol-3-phosphate acyltransferase
MNKFFSIFSKIFLAPIIGIIFIKRITGRNNLPKRNFILASNHQSYLDIVLSGYVCVPKRFTYIGQVDRENKGWSFFRNFIYSVAEVIPVNRNDNESKNKAFDAAIKFLKRGYSLVIYPEGTRTRTGEIQEGKWGAAKIYLATNVPIVPMGIKGAYELYPAGQKPKLKKIVKLNIGKPLYFEEYFEQAKGLSSNSEEYKNILIAITNKVMEEIKKLTYEN